VGDKKYTQNFGAETSRKAFPRNTEKGAVANTDKIGKGYSLEYTKISEAFYTPSHGDDVSRAT
jgi:hypothetical protein